MAYYKECSCGEKIVFEKIMGYPSRCPSCRRNISGFNTINEDDPQVNEYIKSNLRAGDIGSEEKIFVSTKSQKKKYFLKLSNGKEIEIPEEGCIIGRTEVGAEELAEYPSVSRQHLRVTPRRNIGIVIEDISTYGTWVGDQRIEKNTLTRVAVGSKVTLCDLETILTLREDVD